MLGKGNLPFRLLSLNDNNMNRSNVVFSVFQMRRVEFIIFIVKPHNIHMALLYSRNTSTELVPHFEHDV